MKIKISSSDEQNDTQKQVSEEQNAGISQEEILTGKQEQMQVAEKKMNSEVFSLVIFKCFNMCIYLKDNFMYFGKYTGFLKQKCNV